MTLGGSKVSDKLAVIQNLLTTVDRLLIGGGIVVMAFTFLFGSRVLLVHALAVALTAGLMGFVMYLIFALEHPFVGALSVKPAPYVNVLQIWKDELPPPK